jgi:hypothetical protein
VRAVNGFPDPRPRERVGGGAGPTGDESLSTLVEQLRRDRST